MRAHKQVSRSNGSAAASRRFAPLAAVILVAAGTAIASPAWAKRRVVVLGFDGPKAASAESAVKQLVEKKHELVEASEYASAAKRLKARKSTDKNVAKIAKDIQVDAIVTGAIKRKGNRWTLKLSVREGKSGKTLDTVVIRLASPKVDRDAKKEISADLMPIIASAEAIVDAPKKKKTKKKPVEEEDEEPPPDDEEVAFDETAPPPAETVASAEPAPDTTIDATAGEDAAASLAPRRYDAADVSAGVSFIMRNMEFTYDPALTGNQRPNGYAGTPVPGAYVSAEVYPFAFGPKRGPLSNLGLTFDFDRALILKSRMDVSGMGTLEFDTTQQRWGLGARYRIPIGKSERPPTVKAGLGYNRLSFTIDHGTTDIDLPDVEYEYLDLSGGVVVPLGKKLGLLGEFSYLVMLSTGQIQEQAFYGAGSVVGIALDAGVEYKLTARLTARGGVRYQRIAYDFDGTGDDASMRDGDPMDQDVGGALDEYMGGYVLVGYSF